MVSRRPTSSFPSIQIRRMEGPSFRLIIVSRYQYVSIILTNHSAENWWKNFALKRSASKLLKPKHTLSLFLSLTQTSLRRSTLRTSHPPHHGWISSKFSTIKYRKFLSSRSVKKWTTMHAALLLDMKGQPKRRTFQLHALLIMDETQPDILLYRISQSVPLHSCPEC